MGGGAVVPEGNRAGFPFEAYGEFTGHRVFPQQLQQHARFTRAQAGDGLEKTGADVEHLFSALGVHGDQRVLADQGVVPDQLQVFGCGAGARGRAEAVLAAQALEKGLQRLGKRVIGGCQIGPLRVAAIGRNRHAAQNGGRGRIVRGRDIGMPAGPGAALGFAAVAVGAAVLGNRVQLGVALDMAEHRMAYGQLAKLACERHMLLVAQMLVAKEHHFPAQQRRADAVDFGGRPPAARADRRRESARRYAPIAARH